MGTLKELAKRIPVVSALYRTARNAYWRRRHRQQSAEAVFTNIYRTNEWGGKDSVSGTGSDLRQTQAVANALPALFATYQMTSMLDIPCGDYHWMKDVPKESLQYIGADIVEDLVRNNQERYTTERVRFLQLNLLRDPLPDVDLIFCRDCLVHFSFADLWLALTNIAQSSATYLLTTTFVNRKVNTDILTGQWRVLNLQAAPFHWPAPLMLIDEECTEGNGAYADKALGLWRMADLRTAIELHRPAKQA